MKNFKKLFQQKEDDLREAYKKEEKTKIRKIRLMFCLGILIPLLLIYFIAMLRNGYTWNEIDPLIPLLFVVSSVFLASILQPQYYPRWKLRDTFTLSIIKEAKMFGTTEFLGSMITCLQKHFTLSPTFENSLIYAMQGYYWYDGGFTGDSYDMGDALQERLILNINGDEYLLKQWEYTSTHFIFHMENISERKGVQKFKFPV